MMVKNASLIIVFTAGIAASAQASAQELWLGVAAHAVEKPFTKTIGEGGAAIQTGYRGAPIEKLRAIGKPAPYILASISATGDTSLLAAGLSWRLGERLYARPGIGIAVHDGPSRRFAPNGNQTDLGSRILFEPEIAIGWQANDRIAIEASWVHVSHAQLFGRQNPGLDIIGARLVVSLR